MDRLAHYEADWPGKLVTIPWVYAEIVRVLHTREPVEILCHDASVEADARAKLLAHDCDFSHVRLHQVPNERIWLRDSAPTGVQANDRSIVLAHWRFNGWAKYDNYLHDAVVGEAIARLTGLPRITPVRPDDATRVVLEGGAIDTNGAGLLLTTEECLLSPIQERNPGLGREDTNASFATSWR